ncbi:alkene reductase [Rhizobium calliandrae]|uniref:Alkene reductase n=1 Tax=Rhizobium calliandrae TaxID=1312182 RepID=A0ABT7KE88_9HYPH|nr:alkene reductase [Rhizobium calliandrae]MDL2406933.1 alkene reductase [Rhizobium calliandrae]
MTSDSTTHLFSPVRIGEMDLQHRVVMAPLTRMRADHDSDVPTDLMLEYYSQRATKGGLIITEATTITPDNRGYLGAPGIYSDAQVAGWARITDAVHAKGGFIYLQLWQVGRTAHSDISNGHIPVAPSAIPYDGLAFTRNGWVPATPPRALSEKEVGEVIELYRSAAIRAKAAGFDGVEIHAANGYLPDQFLQDISNKRSDRYGGSIENRARFLLDVAAAVKSVWGANHYAVRLSPSGVFNGMGDSDPDALFDHVVRSLDQRELSYLHIVEPRVVGSQDVEGMEHPIATNRLRKLFKAPIISAGGYDGAKAEAVIGAGDAQLVAFGRSFIANPDLPERLRTGAALNSYDRDTFYGGTEKGYVDYPFLQAEAAE